MFGQLPLYQRQGVVAFKKDLTNTLAFTSHLGNPQDLFPSIHVAGTNGKGSVSHMIAAILQTAGYKVGLYTSPHLKDFRERIKINGEEVTEAFVVDFIRKNKEFLEAQDLSFFEMTVGMAFDYFAYKKVDIAVVEVGLGGRLDSTNILKPLLSVITNVGLDHTQILGETLEEIAYEKGGIIKAGVPVVIGEHNERTLAIFSSLARELGSAMVLASETYQDSYSSDLKGSYQSKNIRTAVTAIRQLPSSFPVADKAIHKGLSQVVSTTGLRGRWEVLREHPKVICDVAHNAEALSITLQQLNAEPHNNQHLVLGFVVDKDLERILPLFPTSAQYYFCKPNVPRGISEEVLRQKASNYGLVGTAHSSVKRAYAEALKCSDNEDIIYIGGSAFVVAEVL